MGYSFLPPWVTAAPVTYDCKKKGAAGLLKQWLEPPKPAMVPACWQVPCPTGTEASAEGDSKWVELHQHRLWRRAQLSMWFRKLVLKCLWPNEH